MTRLAAPTFLVATTAIMGVVPTAWAQGPAPGFEGLAHPTRFRLVLNGIGGLTQPSYGDTRTLTEYAEQTRIRASYGAGVGFGPEAAVQASLFRGLGILVGYSYLTRDVTGTADVSRPHPLYLNRPRSASAEMSGYEYAEGALDLDLAFAASAGHFDWALFAGATLFQVEADLLGTPTYDDRYPYDGLTIASTPATTVEESPTGFNVGGRLDYRFGRSRRFGAGVQVRYSAASVKLRPTPDATEVSFDAGGLTVGAGLRVYF